MKKLLFICPSLIAAASSFGQITTAQNGLSQPNASTVQLGGTCSGNPKKNYYFSNQKRWGRCVDIYPTFYLDYMKTKKN